MKQTKGISTFIGSYGMIALTLEEGKYYLSMQGKEVDDFSIKDSSTPNEFTAREYERITIKKDRVTLKVKANFAERKDEVEFFYLSGKEWKSIGVTHRLYFKLDHFTGCRFGLFCYSTKQIGGEAGFREFVYL